MNGPALDVRSDRASKENATDIGHTDQSTRLSKAGQLTRLEETTLDPVRPPTRPTPMTAVSTRLWRQILGLNPFKGSYFGLYRLLRSRTDKLVACLGIIFAITAGIPLPLIGIIFGKLISTFPPDDAELRGRISELLGVAVAFFVVTSAYTISFGRTGEKIAMRLRVELFDSLLRVEQEFLDTRDFDISALLRERIDTIQVGCSEKVGLFIQSMSYFTAAFTVGFILNARLTGILFAAVIPSMTVVVAFGSTSVSKLTRKISRHTEQSSAIVESALRSVKVAQAFDMIDQICDTHRLHLDESTKLGVRKAIVSATELGSTFFIAYAANALAFFIGSQMAASGEANGDAGTIYAVVFLILDASFVVGQFAPLLEIFARAASAYGTLQEVLEASCNTNDLSKVPKQPMAACMRGQEVRFCDVSFS